MKRKFKTADGNEAVALWPTASTRPSPSTRYHALVDFGRVGGRMVLGRCAEHPGHCAVSDGQSKGALWGRFMAPCRPEPCPRPSRRRKVLRLMILNMNNIVGELTATAFQVSAHKRWQHTRSRTKPGSDFSSAPAKAFPSRQEPFPFFPASVNATTGIF
jgi:hypothetical protein